MRLVIFLGALAVICGCTASRGARLADATPSAEPSAPGPSFEEDAVTRVETSAGSFLIRGKNRVELEKLLAGEPTTRPFFAGEP